MCAVFMDVNPLYVFTIDIPAQMRPLVNHQAAVAFFMCEMCEGCSVEAGSDNDIIICTHSLNSLEYPGILDRSRATKNTILASVINSIRKIKLTLILSNSIRGIIMGVMNMLSIKTWKQYTGKTRVEYLLNKGDTECWPIVMTNSASV